MGAEAIFKTLGAARGFFLKTITDLNDEQLLEIPEGFNNNVLWNVGHILYAHCGMTYRPCGVELPIPDSYTDLFKGGSSPSDWSETPPISEVMELFKAQGKQIQTDYAAGKFENYNKVDLFDGYALENIEEALGFNIFHESIHVSTVGKMVKALNAVKA